jgi:F420-dependent oxidoreductase-like protein
MMKIGLTISMLKHQANIPIKMIQQAEELGCDSVWFGEAYGADAVSAAGWVLGQTRRIKVGTGIMQMPARTPTMTAMTAMTLSHISGGRFLAGIGASGPQVVEGWHGVPFGTPLKRLREYIAIMRAVMASDTPVAFDGEIYQLPNKAQSCTGLGKPLRSLLDATPEVPIYSASFTAGGLRVSGEIADGVLPVWFSPENNDFLHKPLQEGLKKRDASLSHQSIDVAAFVRVSIDEDIDAARAPIKQQLGLYIGGMGAKGKNFYNEYFCRFGYQEQAEKIQDLWLSGKQAQAIKAVPDEFVDEVSLVGPLSHVRERAKAWRQAGSNGKIDSMLLSIKQPEYLADVVEMLTGH